MIENCHKIPRHIINLCKIVNCLDGSTYSNCWFNFPSSLNSAQVIFHTLEKTSQCSPKRERKFVLLVAHDRRDYWASIDMKKSLQYFEM